jgi:hypothetical protein
LNFFLSFDQTDVSLREQAAIATLAGGSLEPGDFGVADIVLVGFKGRCQSSGAFAQGLKAGRPILARTISKSL